MADRSPPGALAEVLGHSDAEPEEGSEVSPLPPPSTPWRSDIVDAIAERRPAIDACAQDERGVVTLDIELAGRTGRVVDTRAQPSDLSRRAVRCVERAVAELSVPAFTAETFRFHYPFRLGE
jgi:hypothetical protein